jgi:hypothetical protein
MTLVSIPLTRGWSALQLPWCWLCWKADNDADY